MLVITHNMGILTDVPQISLMNDKSLSNLEFWMNWRSLKSIDNEVYKIHNNSILYFLEHT